MNDSLWNILKQIEEVSVFVGDKLHEIDKDEVKAILAAFNQKKEFWDTQKKYYYELTGFNFDFERVLKWLINNAHKPVTFDEFLALPDEQAEIFFDFWSIEYPEERQRLRQQLQQKIKKGCDFFKYMPHKNKQATKNQAVTKNLIDLKKNNVE